MSKTASIEYTIRLHRPEAHLFEVILRVSRPDPQGQVFSLPAWIPGSYMIRDFAKNIVSVNAQSDGVPIALQQIDKQTWRADVCDGVLVLCYTVYAWDLSVRSAHLDTTHAYFNGTSVFLRVNGQDHLPCQVEIQQPQGVAYAQWRVATSLSRKGAGLFSWGSYYADNYEDLIDHPFEMGMFDEQVFDVQGVPHHLVVTGRHEADLQRICCDLKTICEHHIQLFGEFPDMERYVFLLMVTGDGYGGLEHRNSCSLLCSRYDLALAGQETVSDGYRSFLGLCSHEYFHTWNVKRIMPAAFQPFDLSTEVYTPLLWAFEGITSYYDDLSLCRCGLIDERSYLELLGQTLTRLQRSAGRFLQTVTQSSFNTWTKFYKQDENAPNAIVSYYIKGAVIALALDLHLRIKTSGRVTLDHVMQALWETYGRIGKGVRDDDIQELVEQLSGVDLSDFFHNALHTTIDMPAAALLQRFGVVFQLRQAGSQTDKGGKPAGTDIVRLSMGLRYKAHASGVEITHVLSGGAALDAGMAAGDIIIAVNGIRADALTFEKRLQNFKPDEVLQAHVFRRDELRECSVTLRSAERDTCYLEWDESCDDETGQRRTTWLTP
ncbi:MAG TPA: M61 family peptidase [Gammaproteobacteria bacterium]|nr:M61 family peptidase [Gammaproteobacteria bacterium]